jgi:hypothetical protein
MHPPPPTAPGAPPRVSDHSRLFRRDVTVPRTTLSGLTGLSESSERRRDDIGSSQPPRRFDDHEAFRRSAPPDGPKTARQLPRLRRPLRVRAKVPSPVLHGPVRPSWGSAPLQRHRRRDPHDPGLPHPARSVLGVSHPLDGFLSLQPRGHARSAAALGFLSRSSFGQGGRGASPHPLRPLVHGAPSLEL